MNKTKILLLAAIALIVVGGLGGWVAFSSSGNLIDIADARTLNDSFDSIVIHTDKAWLDIRPTEGEVTVVEVAGKVHKSVAYSLDAEVANGVLTVSVIENSRSSLVFLFPTHLNVLVSLPEKQYNSLQLEVGGNHGEVYLERLNINEINYKTSSSGITLQTITAKNVSAETTSATIIFTDVNSETIATETKSAKTSFENVEANVITARATSGEIVLITSHIDRKIDMETNSGKILIKTEQKPANVLFEVATTSGEVNLLDGRYIGGQKIGAGEHTVQLSSTSGSITIEVN